MLIFRYIARDLFASTLAVSFVLLLVVVSGRFVKYLAQAAAGQLDASVLLAVMGYRIPEFLVLIVPLGFFLGILLTYGRLYIENEMTVMTACGMSQGRLVSYTLAIAVIIAALAGWLSLYVTPDGLAKSEGLLLAQKQRAEIENILPNQFLVSEKGSGVTYTEEVTPDGELRRLFFAERAYQESGRERLALVVAEKAFQWKGQPDEPGYLVLENGYRIEGAPGEADYRVTHFAEYGQRLAITNEDRKPTVDVLSTDQLWQSPSQSHIAALQWRLSVPILVLVVSLMAIPLSKTDPRQGRFNKLVPAILLYIIYLVALNAARGALEGGNSPQVFGRVVGLWGVHAVFVLLTCALFGFPKLMRVLSNRRRRALLAAGGGEA